MASPAPSCRALPAPGTGHGHGRGTSRDTGMGRRVLALPWSWVGVPGEPHRDELGFWAQGLPRTVTVAQDNPILCWGVRTELILNSLGMADPRGALGSLLTPGG